MHRSEFTGAGLFSAGNGNIRLTLVSANA